MKDWFLGFVVGVALCLGVYVVWEDYRHVPVIIREIKFTVPVPVPMPAPRAHVALIKKEAPFRKRGLP